MGKFLSKRKNYSNTVILLLTVLFKLTLTFQFFRSLTLILSPKHTPIHFLINTFTRARRHTLVLTFLLILEHFFIFLLLLGLIGKFMHPLIFIYLIILLEISNSHSRLYYTHIHNYALTRIYN